MTCQGSGTKKKFAKKEAAWRMLARMDSAGCSVVRAKSFTEDDIRHLAETVGDSTMTASRRENQPDNVAVLQRLCSREGPGRPQPSYQDSPTPPVGRFSIQCSLGSLRTEGRGSSKVIFSLNFVKYYILFC